MRNERGMTLVEVLAALVLVGLAVTMFAALSKTASVHTNVEDRRSAALEIAENELNHWKERFKRDVTLPVFPYGYEPEASSGYTVRVLQGEPLGSEAEPASFYAGQLADVPASHVSMQTVVWRESKAQLLTVVVYWTEAGP